MLQNATSLGESAPWHLWWTCLLYCACHAKCIFADPLETSHACYRFWTCYKILLFCSRLTRCRIPSLHLPDKTTSERPRVNRTRQFLTLLTSTCASRHNGVHFLDMSTSKSGPNLVCFVHFDLEMCFAPQRRAIFRHLNFQKCSEHEVFCTFWLGNALCATTACACSTSQLPKMVRTRQFLTLLASKCASRHTGAQFFISHMARWLRARRFSESTFRPSGATKHWKNSESRLFYLFARLHLLPSDSFSSLIFLLLLFS